MKKDWKESQERTIPLPDDEPEIFNLYVQWKYQGRVLSRDATVAPERDSDELRLLAKAYIFGEKIQDSTFQRHCP